LRFLWPARLARGFAPYEITALAALWAVHWSHAPLRSNTLIPLGAIVMLSMFFVVLRRAANLRVLVPLRP